MAETDPIGLVLQFGDDIEKRLNSISKGFAAIYDEASRAGSNINDVFKNMTSKELNKAIDKMSELKTTLGSIGQDVDNDGIKKSLNEVIDCVNNVMNSIYKLNDVAKDARKNNKDGLVEDDGIDALIGMKDAVESLALFYDELKSKAKAASESMSSGAKGFKDLFESLLGAGDDTASSFDAILAYSKETKVNIADIKSTIDLLEASIENLSFGEDDFHGKVSELNAEIERHKNTINEALLDTRQLNTEYEKELDLKSKISSLKMKESEGYVLSGTENALLYEYEDELSRVQEKIGSIEEKYPELASEARKAFTVEELEWQIKELEKEEQSLNRINEAYRKTYEGAIEFSGKNTSTIKQRTEAISVLNEAINNLDMTDSGYKEKMAALNAEIEHHKEAINEATGKSEELNKEHGKLSDSARKLKTAMAGIFSIQQITRFLKQMVNVRGEFELQHTSLQAIIQDVDKANELWEKTTALAVRSPFTVKELVSYTKQLAAYRIETDKIYDVTKQLADVSSGLGVDMSRLILAYGQVKSANYLRGQELRQFSEAGLNILGELSDYFSMVEGRAVSVGDVFERVSKRMVKFEDVAYVFNKITSEGGVFYNMQEKQAETLKGQISNLRDSIDLMFNDIGKANDGVLKGSVSLVRSIVNDWRGAAPVLTISSLSLMAIKTLTKQCAVETAVARGETERWKWSLNNVKNGFKGVLNAIKSNAVGIAIVAVTTLVSLLTKAAREARQFNKELDRMFSESAANAKTLVDTFERLARKLNEVNEGSDEHRRIIDTLNSNYGEYIGFLVNEKTSYDDLTEAIRHYNDEITHKAMYSAIEKAVEKAYTETAERIDKFKRGLLKKQIMLDNRITKATSDDINNVFSVIEKRVEESGKLSRGEIASIMETYYGGIFDADELIGSGTRVNAPFLEGLYKASKEYAKLRKTTDALSDRINTSFSRSGYAVKELYNEMQKLNDEEKKAIKSMEEYNKFSAGSEDEQITQYEKEERILAIKLEYEKKRYLLEQKYNKPGTTEDNLDASQTRELEKRLAAVRKNADITIDDVRAKMDEFEKSLLASAESPEMRKATRQIGDSSIESISKYGESVGELKKYVKEQYDLIKSSIATREALSAAETAYSEEELELDKIHMQFIMEEARLLGMDLTEKKKSADSDNESMKLLRDRLDALKDANSEYEKLIKNDSEASGRVADSFAKRFAQLGIGDITEGMTFDKAGILKVFSGLVNIAGEEGERAMLEFQSGFLSETEDAEKKKILEGFKDTFERMLQNKDLYNELTKEGFSADLFEVIFGREPVSDSMIKNWASSIESVIKQYGENGAALWNEIESKLNQMENDALIERTKNYVSYIKEMCDDRLKIEREYLNKLSEVEKTGYTDAMKDSITQQLRKEREEALSKLDWSGFKDTSFYTEMFGDMENVSSRVLGIMKQKLQDVKDNLHELDPSDMKEIAEQMEKIDEELRNRDYTGLKNMKSDYEAMTDYYKNAAAYAGQLEQYEEEIAALERDRDSYVRDIAIWESQINSGMLDESSTEMATDELERLRGYLNDATEKLKAAGVSVDDLTGKMNKGRKGAKDYDDDVEKVAETIRNMADVASEAGGLLIRMFADSDSAAEEYLDTTMDIANSSADLASNIGRIAATGGADIQAWIGAAKDLVNIIGNTFDYNEIAQNEKIERQEQLIEKLQSSYEELESAMDKTWDISELENYTNLMEANIDKQIAAYEAILAADSKKKKNDRMTSEETDEISKEIEDLNSQLDDLQASFIEKTGGIGADSYASAAESFADAWLTAFEETGDGLSGLEETWDEYIDNVIKKQLTLRGINKYLEPVFDYLDNKMLADGEATAEEMLTLTEMIETANAGMDEYMKGLASILGAESDSESSELSGLTQSIQGMSEQTAEVLTGYLNSIRFMMSQQTEQVSSLCTAFTSENTPNPILSQLKTQTEQIKAIRDLFDSVVDKGNSKGRGVKVYMQ